MFGRTGKVMALAGGIAAAAFSGAAARQGAGSSDPDTAGGPDICTRLTSAEVAGILRTPVALAEPNTDAGARSCVYSLTRDGPTVVVSQLAGDWEAVRATFRTSDPQPVSGLGRQALWYPVDHALQVEADNGSVLRVGFDPGDASEIAGRHKPLAVDLARAALVALK
jgi:hypothetical protein